jgi:hypothetical protein
MFLGGFSKSFVLLGDLIWLWKEKVARLIILCESRKKSMVSRMPCSNSTFGSQPSTDLARAISAGALSDRPLAMGDTRFPISSGDADDLLGESV